MTHDEAHEFYKDPAHREAVGPAVAARVRGPLLHLRYEGVEAPATETINTGSLPRIIRLRG